jgi:serine/threonine-protein kinase HipA
MTKSCRICLRPTSEGDDHPHCLKHLFGRPERPPIDVDPANLHWFGQEMAGRTSVSGVQRKVSLGWSHKHLRVAAGRASYLLKPAEGIYPCLPENEHLTMRLAELAGLPVPAFGLVPLSDGRLAYLVKRFDRRGHGRRIAMEDFCQLAELPPAEKYQGSAEQCLKLLRRFSSAPGVDAAWLFRQFLFAWWVGNGDLHRKNLALLCPSNSEARLSPVYDLVNTAILIPGDQLALTVRGKRANLGRREWLDLGSDFGLPIKLVERELQRLSALLESAVELVNASFLSADLKVSYRDQLAQQSHLLC